MRHLDLLRTSPLRILCLGAHCDDIEIGCGGTVMRLIGEGETRVRWVVFSSTEERRGEAERSARVVTGKASHVEVAVHSFEDGYFPYVGAEIKRSFEDLAHGFDPDLVFTHRREDLHQDHRTVCELTWNTFRDHLILEYEIPKYDGDLGQPNFYVPLDEQICAAKVECIMKHFESQRRRDWFTPDTFYAPMRLRGVEARSSGGYAEAFHCRKVVFR